VLGEGVATGPGRDPAAGEGSAEHSGTSASMEVPRNYMVDDGERLVDQGYNVLSLMPSSKKPGMYLGRRWRNLTDWMRYSTRIPTELEMRRWKEWPGTGVGVLCGRVVAVDIDVPDPEVSDQMRQLGFNMLGETDIIRIGQAPKQLLVYRSQELIKPMKLHPIEVLGHGNQFAAYGIHPGTGYPYSYPFEDLVDVHQSDLPLVDEDKLRAFLGRAFEMIPPEFRKQKLISALSKERFYSTNGNLRGTPEAVADAMSYIRNHNLDYDSWVYVGMALKGALGDEGFALWMDFSRQSPEFDKKESSARTWWSLKPNGIGAGTVYHLARLNGWKPPSGMFLDPAVKEAVETVDLSAFLKNAHTKRAGGRG
jgi:hypothetical protein